MNMPRPLVPPPAPFLFPRLERERAPLPGAETIIVNGLGQPEAHVEALYVRWEPVPVTCRPRAHVFVVQSLFIEQATRKLDELAGEIAFRIHPEELFVEYVGLKSGKPIKVQAVCIWTPLRTPDEQARFIDLVAGHIK